MIIPVSISRKTAACVIFAVYICMECATVIALVSGPAFQRTLSLSDAQLGFCLGAFSAGTLLTSIGAGYATERFGTFRTMSSALAGLIGSLLLIAWSRHFITLTMGLIAAGIAVAIVHNTGLTLLADIFPQRTRRIMSLASALWFSSSVISAPLIGAWMARARIHDMGHWSYGAPSLTVALLLACCLLAVVRKLRWTAGIRTPVVRSDPAPRGRARGWIWIPVLGFLHGCMAITFIAWVNPMIQNTFLLDDFRGSLGYAVFALGLAAGRFFLTFKHFALDDRMLLGISGIGGGCLLTLALFWPSYSGMLIATGVAAFTASATAPCLFSIVASRFPAIKSRLYGCQEAAIALGGMIGPFCVGLLAATALPLRHAMLLSPLAATILGATALLWLKIKPATSG